MKASRYVLLGILAAAAAGASPPAAPPAVSLEAPPGWKDVTSQQKTPGVLFALKGPESSSFVVARANGAPIDNGAEVLAYLAQVLEGVRTGSGADYRAAGEVKSQTFRNGLKAQMLRATLDGKPRLVIALIDAGGAPLLGTLSSAAPEAMLTPLFGALRVPSGAVRAEGVARSLDDQLEIALGGGLRMRELTGDEKEKGAVLVIQGAGSEVLFIKQSGDDASPKDQAAIVRVTAADAVKAALESVSPSRRAPTAAGPAAVYAWVGLPSSPDLRFAAGYLPWSYWGYSLLARGPQADELLVGALAAIKAGPSAVPGLLAQSPVLEIPDEGSGSRTLLAAAALGALALLAAFAWSGGRKKDNLSP